MRQSGGLSLVTGWTVTTHLFLPSAKMQIESYIGLSRAVWEFGGRPMAAPTMKMNECTSATSANTGGFLYFAHGAKCKSSPISFYQGLLGNSGGRPMAAPTEGCGFFAALRMTVETWKAVTSGRLGRCPLHSSCGGGRLRVVHLKLTLDFTSLLMFNYN